jgi:hypothetical protein
MAIDPTLTPQTKIQVGLAVTLVCSAVGLYALVWNTGEGMKAGLDVLSGKVEERYISKELFNAQFEALKRETDLNLRTLNEKLSEVKSEVAALRLVTGSGK